MRNIHSPGTAAYNALESLHAYTTHRCLEDMSRSPDAPSLEQQRRIRQAWTSRLGVFVLKAVDNTSALQTLLLPSQTDVQELGGPYYLSHRAYMDEDGFALRGKALLTGAGQKTDASEPPAGAPDEYARYDDLTLFVASSGIRYTGRNGYLSAVPSDLMQPDVVARPNRDLYLQHMSPEERAVQGQLTPEVAEAFLLPLQRWGVSVNIVPDLSASIDLTLWSLGDNQAGS